VTAPLETLRVAYQDLTRLVTGLTDDDGWRPTGCAGWCVRDLVQHHLLDGQRALVALATPAGRAADTDAVTYWADWRPGTDAAGLHRRQVRIMSGVWSRLEGLGRMYAETLAAVLVAAGRADPAEVVATQGHAVRVDDLLTTLAVEAAVHHLDLVAGLDAPGPGAGPLRAVRATLDGLLGVPGPAAWSDERWALLGTGRASPTAAEREELGPAAERLPLFG
jgi:Mycothiol maleylpyruvate isomerase N-terminal domain